MREPLEQLTAQYNESNPQTLIKLNYASPQTLESQIRIGAKIDLFVCEIQSMVDSLHLDGLTVESSQVALFKNHTVLFVPKGNDLGIASFDTLLSDRVGKIAVADKEKQASGYFANRAIAFIDSEDSLAGKIVYKDSANEAVLAVELGEADAGISFYSDIHAAKSLEAIAISPEEAIYTASVVSASENQSAAEAFALFIGSEASLGLFYSYGFKPLYN
jgi:molybdate transport system substrate-binding protein